MLERFALSGEEENLGLPVAAVCVGGEAEEEHEGALVFCCGTVVFGAEEEWLRCSVVVETSSKTQSL